MSTLSRAKQKTLKDKHLLQEAEAKARRLERKDEVEKEKILKENKS